MLRISEMSLDEVDRRKKELKDILGKQLSNNLMHGSLVLVVAVFGFCYFFFGWHETAAWTAVPVVFTALGLSSFYFLPRDSRLDREYRTKELWGNLELDEPGAWHTRFLEGLRRLDLSHDSYAEIVLEQLVGLRLKPDRISRSQDNESELFHFVGDCSGWIECYDDGDITSILVRPNMSNPDSTAIREIEPHEIEEGLQQFADALRTLH